MGVVYRQTAPTASPTWDYIAIALKEYHEGGASAGATRRILVGKDEGAEDFIIRYFTVPPGGHSAYDQHRHQHGVIIVQGSGRVLLDTTWTDIAVGDAIFIGPNEIHQFQANPSGPLGFICVIPAWAKASVATTDTSVLLEATL